MGIYEYIFHNSKILHKLCDKKIHIKNIQNTLNVVTMYGMYLKSEMSDWRIFSNSLISLFHNYFAI